MSNQEFIKWRESLKMSQKDIAQLIGVTHQGVSLWEAGKRKIPATTVRLIKLFQKYPQLIGEF